MQSGTKVSLLTFLLVIAWESLMVHQHALTLLDPLYMAKGHCCFLPGQFPLEWLIDQQP